MSDQQEKLTQFVAITGANEDRARFFLDSSGWQVEVAMARFYENETDDAVAVVEDDAPPAPSTTESSDSSPQRQQQKRAGAARTRSSNLHTLNTITTSSDEEEEGQAYYAGGSENSGQQVLGPPRRNPDRNIVHDMFRSVQENGVEIVDRTGGAAAAFRMFSGTGYKLGSDDSTSEVVRGASAPARSPQVTLKLWQNGFSVDDEDVRAYTDPANRDFLNCIRRGEIPQELRQGGTEIDLVMEDHSMENFRRTEGRRVKAFQGQGYTLGSPAPPVVGSASSEDAPANEAKAKEEANVDASKPTTNLQIRLADGSRLVGQFNHEHTVAAVRNYIGVARPQYRAQPFDLLSSFPTKVLEDGQTLAEAGILNSAILQKLT